LQRESGRNETVSGEAIAPGNISRK
jgi:hypothetical protein